MLRGLLLEERLLAEVLRELVRASSCRRAGDRRRAPAGLSCSSRVVRDVLADALLARALEVHDRRLAEEVVAGLELEPLELVALDLER